MRQGVDKIDTSIASLLDVTRFRPWLQEHARVTDEPLRITRLSGGASNITICIEQGERRWVMRRPPVGNQLTTAHDMGREYAFYRAMQGTAVPVPETVAICDDVSICGVPFYVMKFVDGRILGRPEELDDVTLDQRRLFCRELARTLVAIHRVDIDAVGLGDIGKREGFLERQVRHWTGQWDKLRTEPNKTIDEVVRRFLRAKMPPSQRSTVVHGDYRIGNVMVAPGDPTRIVAVLDWEMGTLGDPLADLAYSLVFWGAKGDADADPNIKIADLPGFCTTDEFVAEYVQAGGVATDHLDYYMALAWFKLSMIVQGHIDRAARTKRAVTSSIVKHRDLYATRAIEAFSNCD